MNGRAGAWAGRYGRPFLVLAAAAWAVVQLFRLLAAERAITGGLIALPLDDSFIYLQYARAMAEGHPFVYTPGNAPTTGSTSLWYPLLLLPPHLLRLAPGACIGWALGLGAVFYASSALLLARLGKRLGGPAGGVLAPVFFLASPHLLWGYFSGMEIGFYGTVLLATIDAYLRERSEAQFPTLRWWVFALAGARPEGAVLCFVIGLLVLWDRRRASRTPGARRPLSPALLLPLAAGALPFLVNLALTGNVESTSSQAKSILSEPYAESRTDYIRNSPTIALNIAEVYLSHLVLDRQSRLIPALMMVSGVGLFLFAGFAFRRRRGVRVGGTVLLLVAAAGVVVNSMPVYWQIHLFRYQQGLFPLILLIIGAGWGRLASWAWERLPRWAGAPGAAIVGLAPLAVCLPLLVDANAGMMEFYGRNCENIAHQQVRLGTWIDQNLPQDSVVGLNDAGAVAYYGRRSTVDLVGITTAGFARVYRSGLGCLFEHVRRLPPRRLPTHLAIYPDWFHYWPESGILGPEIFRAHLDLNTICGGTDMVLYPASWGGVQPTDRPVLLDGGLEQSRLIDSVDLAWLEDERRHEWNAEPEAKDVLRRYGYAGVAAAPLTDGGRIVRGTQRFRADVEPGHDLTIVMRTDAWYPTRLDVNVDGKPAGTWSIALSETAWVEPRFHVRGDLLTRRRPEFTLVREVPSGTRGEEVGRDYSVFRLWLYQ